MAGETANIADVANKISKDIFEFFRWECIVIEDLNFKCEKIENHFPKTEGSKKTITERTHPVDVVFKYFDPYLNKHILLNTDLKCYASNSITAFMLQGALESLAKTIDCARVSDEWQGRYHLDDTPYEIRGLCFLYNHDNIFHKEIDKIISGIKTDRIPLKSSQILHLIDPVRIRYLNTVVADVRHLQATHQMPKENYNFFYPDLILHKIHSDNGSRDNYAATIETICAPFMVISHAAVTFFNEKESKVETKDNAGYIIYYNQQGETDYEFMYLFDFLSRFQILISEKSIKIRIAHHSPSSNLKSNYARAKRLYLDLWGADKARENDLERIQIEAVKNVVPYYNPGLLAWKYDND